MEATMADAMSQVWLKDKIRFAAQRKALNMLYIKFFARFIAVNFYDPPKFLTFEGSDPDRCRVGS